MAKGIPLMGRDPDGKAKIINVDENGNVKVQLSGNNVSVSYEGQAWTTENNVNFDVSHIVFISNDGDYDITFNFDATTTEAGAFTLKPGEVLSDLPRQAKKLHYKSALGSPYWRALGVK